MGLIAYYRINAEATITGPKYQTAYWKKFKTEADELEWEERMDDIYGESHWELIQVDEI